MMRSGTVLQDFWDDRRSDVADERGGLGRFVRWLVHVFSQPRRCGWCGGEMSPPIGSVDDGGGILIYECQSCRERAYESIYFPWEHVW